MNFSLKWSILNFVPLSDKKHQDINSYRLKTNDCWTTMFWVICYVQFSMLLFMVIVVFLCKILLIRNHYQFCSCVRWPVSREAHYAILVYSLFLRLSSSFCFYSTRFVITYSRPMCACSAALRAKHLEADSKNRFDGDEK